MDLSRECRRTASLVRSNQEGVSMTVHVFPRLARTFQLAALLLASPLHCVGQVPCQGQWSAGLGIPGLDAPAYSLTQWDPDGGGPQATTVVACGNFAMAGDSRADGLAMIDVPNRTISPFPMNVGRHYAQSLAMPNGDLIVGGFFGTIQTGSFRVARWNGASWQLLSEQMQVPIKSLVVSPQGELYA